MIRLGGVTTLPMLTIPATIIFYYNHYNMRCWVLEAGTMRTLSVYKCRAKFKDIISWFLQHFNISGETCCVWHLELFDVFIFFCIICNLWCGHECIARRTIKSSSVRKENMSNQKCLIAIVSQSLILTVRRLILKLLTIITPPLSVVLSLPRDAFPSILQEPDSTLRWFMMIWENIKCSVTQNSVVRKKTL